jgi:hypothetical protein
MSDERAPIHLRFGRWALIVIVVLLLSSVTGIIINSVIEPQRYTHTYSVPYPTAPPPPQIRTDLVVGLKVFPPLKSEPDAVTRPLRDAIESVIQKSRTVQFGPSNNYYFAQEFDRERMAEEWARFGTELLRGKLPTSKSITEDSAVIERKLWTLLETQEPALAPCKINIESMSISGSDAVVLVKHVGTRNDRLHTWYGRWWLTQSSTKNWRIYDFELQPSRIRANAYFAALDTGRLRGSTDRDPASLEKLATEILTRTNHGMTTGRLVDFPGSHFVITQSSNRPMEAIKTLLLAASSNIADKAHRKRAAAALKQWPETPLAELALLQGGDALPMIRTFRANYGPTPWGLVIESEMLTAAKQPDAARAALESGLAANPGQPLLITALRTVTPKSDWPLLAVRSAEGQDPGTAIREFFSAIIADDALRSVVKAYREVLPDEPEGCLAQAVLLATDDHLMAESAKLLTAALATGDTAIKADRKRRFILAVHDRSDARGDPIDATKDADLAAVLNRK